MNDEEAHGSQADLGHLIAVGMVHLRAMLFESEFVHKCLSRHDGFLG